MIPARISVKLESGKVITEEAEGGRGDEKPPILEYERKFRTAPLTP